MTNPERITQCIEEAPPYLLRLFIAGDESNSLLARENLKLVCSEYLNRRCRIEEVDVLIDFASALENKVFVTPTLILVEPEPRARIVGNLGNKERVISALRLRFEHGK